MSSAVISDEAINKPPSGCIIDLWAVFSWRFRTG